MNVNLFKIISWNVKGVRDTQKCKSPCKVLRNETSRRRISCQMEEASSGHRLIDFQEPPVGLLSCSVSSCSHNVSCSNFGLIYPGPVALRSAGLPGKAFAARSSLSHPATGKTVFRGKSLGGESSHHKPVAVKNS